MAEKLLKQTLSPRSKYLFLVEIYPNGAIDVPSVITDMVADVSGGGVTTDALERHYLNHKKEYASRMNQNELTIVFEPDESPQYDDFIKSYLKAIKDPETGYRKKQEELDVDINIILLDRGGKEISKWKFENCWLKEWDGINTDYKDTTTPFQSTTTWSVELIR